MGKCLHLEGLVGCTVVGLGEALGVVQGEVLNTPVAAVDQPVIGAEPAGMDRLFHGVEHDAGGGRRADFAAHDAPGIGINHEGGLGEPSPSMDAGQVDYPEGIGSADAELRRKLVPCSAHHSSFSQRGASGKLGTLQVIAEAARKALNLGSNQKTWPKPKTV